MSIQCANGVKTEHLIMSLQGQGDPLCKHFGECGGCSLQHLKLQDYQNFKTEKFKEVIQSLNANTVLKETIFIPAATRRRTTLSLYKSGALYVAGFKRRQSLKIIPITECKVLHPELQVFIPDFLKQFQNFIPHETQVKLSLTLVDDGVDIFISGCKPPKDAALIECLETVQHTDITRIVWSNEFIYQRMPSTVTFAGAAVSFPSAAFLQPSLEGEKTLQHLVSSMIHSKKKLKIVDLFAGLGTFSFGLAEKHDVHVVESERNSIEAQKQAIAAKQVQKNNMTFEIRDLFRDPLSVFELNKYDAVVCNPPRQGAEAQTKILAASKVKDIIIVSCSPHSFVRDAAILLQAGFKLNSITPVDQFIYSTHLECVAFFSQ